MSKFPVNSKVAFESYAYFIVLYLLYCTCWIGHYVVYFSCQHDKYPTRRLFPQTNELERNILHTYFMYLKASTDVKISTFFGGKWGDEAVDHKMDL